MPTNLTEYADNYAAFCRVCERYGCVPREVKKPIDGKLELVLVASVPKFCTDISCFVSTGALHIEMKTVDSQEKLRPLLIFSNQYGAFLLLSGHQSARFEKDIARARKAKPELPDCRLTLTTTVASEPPVSLTLSGLELLSFLDEDE